MRCIDADKLCPDCLTKEGRVAISQSQIANAPTVELLEQITIKCDTEEDKQKLLSALRNARLEVHVEEERPTGEWEWVQYDANPNIGNWHCSECRYIPHGKKEYQKTNFCPNCGADMRGGGKC